MGSGSSEYWRPIWKAQGMVPNVTDGELSGRSTYNIYHRRALISDAIIGLELDQKDDLLDVGCAAGFSGYFLSQQVRRYVGLDYSWLALDAFHEMYAEKALVCATADSLPFQAESFDKAYMGSVLLCLSKAEGEAALRELRRVVRRRLYVADTMFGYADECPLNNKPGCLCLAHITSYDLDEFIEMTARAGWVQQKIVPMHWCLPHYVLARDCILE